MWKKVWARESFFFLKKKEKRSDFFPPTLFQTLKQNMNFKRFSSLFLRFFFFRFVEKSLKEKSWEMFSFFMCETKRENKSE